MEYRKEMGKFSIGIKGTLETNKSCYKYIHRHGEQTSGNFSKRMKRVKYLKVIQRKS